MTMLTRAAIVDVEKIARLVGESPDRRWSRGRQTTTGADGVSKLDFFCLPIEERVARVAEFVEAGKWSPLLAHEHKKPSGGTRTIINCNTVEQAAQYLVVDALEPLIRPILTKNCLAYVQGRRQTDSIVNTIETARGFRYAVTADIHHFFDEVNWRHLERKLRDLPLAGDLVEWLMALVRVDTIDRGGKHIQRTKGVPQGLVLAPALANLYLAALDKQVSKRLGSLGVQYRRYSDNFFFAAKSLELARKATAVLEEELGVVRLKLKPATKCIYDLRNEHNAPTWLGITFTQNDAWAGAKVIESKAAELQREIDAGLLDEADVDARLESRRRYYEGIISPERAQEAVAAIRSKIETALVCKTIGGADSVRKQVEPTPDRAKRPQADEACSGPTENGAKSPGAPGCWGERGIEITTSHVGAPGLEGPEPGPDSPSIGSRTSRSPERDLPRKGHPGNKIASRSNQDTVDDGSEGEIKEPSLPTSHIARPMEGPQPFDAVKPESTPTTCVATEPTQVTSGPELPSGSQEFELPIGGPSAPGVPSPSLHASHLFPGREEAPGADPANQHRFTRVQNLNTANKVRSMIELEWKLTARKMGSTIVLYAHNPRREDWWFDTMDDCEKLTSTEAEAAGLVEGLRRLREERPVGAVELLLRDKTLVGYFELGWAVRSPRVGPHLRDLFEEIDRLGAERVTFASLAEESS